MSGGTQWATRSNTAQQALSAGGNIRFSRGGPKKKNRPTSGKVREYMSVLSLFLEPGCAMKRHQKMIPFYREFIDFRVLKRSEDRTALTADGKTPLLVLERPADVVPKAGKRRDPAPSGPICPPS